jgi:hypothetical protein
MPVTFTEKLHAALAARAAPDRLTLPDPATAVIVPPPQLPVSPLGVDTTKPAGSESVNPTPVSVAPAFGFERLKVNVVLAFTTIVAAPNTLPIVGGAGGDPPTVMLAEAGLPLPPSFEVTALVVLFCTPELMPVTFTEKLHAALAARAAPDRLTLPDPAVVAIVPPPQLPVRPFGVDTTRPAGNESVNPTPVSEAPAFGFERLKVSVVLAFSAIVAAPNALPIVGGTGGGPPTVMLAEAVLPLPPSFEVTALVVLFCTPELMPVTFTEKLHAALAARAALDRLRLPDPAVAVIVPPPQLPVRPLGVDTTKPAGNESVNPTPVSVEPAFGFERLKVKVVLAFSAIVVAPNVLPIVGGAGFVEPPPATPPQPLRVKRVPPIASSTIANTEIRNLNITAVTFGE